MVKVMFFRPMMYMGGTEIAILNLIRVLDKTKFDIYIGYTDDTSDKQLLDRMAKYAKIVNIRENKVTIDIMVNCSPYKSSTEYFGNVNFKKMYLWFHHFGDRGETVFYDENYIHLIDKVITVSLATKNKMLEKSYASKIQCEIDVIYNIIDKDVLLNKASEKYDVDNSKQLNLVTIGRLCQEKGFERIHVLAEELLKRNIDFKWYIVGGSYYKEEEDRIKAMFENLKDKFVFLGMQQNPYKVLKKCDYLVQLSDYETWGLAITEAKLLGVPCIVSDFEAAYEQIKDMENGIILSREHTETYKDRIDDILNNKEKFKVKLEQFDYNINKIIELWEEKLSAIE